MIEAFLFDRISRFVIPTGASKGRGAEGPAVFVTGLRSRQIARCRFIRFVFVYDEYFGRNDISFEYRLQ